ncbi:MAG: AAA domain-containing protein, partial [Verrucomicrobiota bacterium]
MLSASRVKRIEFLSGVSPFFESPDGEVILRGSKWAKFAREKDLYGKDRETSLATTFLVGRWEDEDGSAVEVCAPILSYSIQIREGDGDVALLNLEDAQLSLDQAFLEKVSSGRVVQEISRLVGDGSSLEVVHAELVKLLQPFGCDGALLEKYPELLARRRVSGIRTSAGDGLKLVPAMALMMVDQSVQMRGIMSELAALGEVKSFSAPLQAFLAGGEVENAGGTQQKGNIERHPARPYLMTAAQEKILSSAQEHPLSVIIGPPGTGKSFTIAALAIETMAAGGSVLIATRSDAAVDVVDRKIIEAFQLEGVTVRAGRKEYLKKLKTFLENCLSGYYQAGPPQPLPKVKGLKDQLQKVAAKMERRVQWEHRVAAVLNDSDPGMFRRWRQKRLRKKVLKVEELWALTKQYFDLLSQIEQVSLADLKQRRERALATGVSKHYRYFQELLAGVRARTASRKDEKFSTVLWPAVFRAMPIWLSN